MPSISPRDFNSLVQKSPSVNPPKNGKYVMPPFCQSVCQHVAQQPAMSAHLAVRDDDELGAALVVHRGSLAREHIQYVSDNHPGMGADLGGLFLLGPLDDIACRKDAGVVDQLESGFDFDEARRRERRRAEGSDEGSVWRGTTRRDLMRGSAGCKGKAPGKAYDEVSIGYLCPFAGDKANSAFLGKRVYMLVEKQLDVTGTETGRETLAERRWVGAVEKLVTALDDGHLLVLRHESEDECVRDKQDVRSTRP